MIIILSHYTHTIPTAMHTLTIHSQYDQDYLYIHYMTRQTIQRVYNQDILIQVQDNQGANNNTRGRPRGPRHVLPPSKPYYV